LRVDVELDSEAARPVTRDVSGQLKFPSGLRPVPAIYWFRFTGVGVTRHYVGEAEDLVRRMAGYRAGYEKQTTNRRLNLRMHEHRNDGGHLEMSIATSGAVTVDGERRPLDLGRKVSRLLAEAAAMHAVRRASHSRTSPASATAPRPDACTSRESATAPWPRWAAGRR